MNALQETSVCRRLPIGAEISAEGGALFRVWAPQRRSVEVVFEDTEEFLPPIELVREPGGYFSGHVHQPLIGAKYRFRLDQDDHLTLPDPASRYQPHGPFGPSQVVDPSRFAWTDAAWNGVPKTGHIIYELHIGTFTREGTWRAAEYELAELAATGITLIEMMPVADFAGRFGWGYDGVNLFAPTRLYGEPDDLRSFINRAHALGMGVILDVVYNHFGVVGNFQPCFAPYYHSVRHRTEWGDAINFDGENAGPVREFFAANARYWIEEFHFDGFRFDATQAIYDDSPRHILAEIGCAARQAAAGKQIYLVGENEPQDVRAMRSVDQGGFGFDALWNDDAHHSLLVRLTGQREAYYSDYFGTPEELVSAARFGFLYQGQLYPWQDKPRGTPTFDLSQSAFVNFIENHDQVANSAHGWRVWQRTSPGRFRAATAYLLLAPGTPLLFQGQEFSATSPFLYFHDGPPDMAESIARGRAEFLRQFPSLAAPEMRQQLANPGMRATFERCQLDFDDRRRQAASYQMHRDLIWLRRRDAVFARQSAMVDGARLTDDALMLRFFGGGQGDRLILVNFGATLDFRSAPQPLLAPPEKGAWRLLWSSEHPDYGGAGTPEVITKQGWHLPGESAVVLTSSESGSA